MLTSGVLARYHLETNRDPPTNMNVHQLAFELTRALAVTNLKEKVADDIYLFQPRENTIQPFTTSLIMNSRNSMMMRSTRVNPKAKTRPALVKISAPLRQRCRPFLSCELPRPQNRSRCLCNCLPETSSTISSPCLNTLRFTFM